MKARIKDTVKRQVLCVNLDEEKKRLVEAACSADRAEMISASAEQGAEKVGAFFGLNGYSFSGRRDITVSAEVLVISGFDDTELMQFVSRLRQLGARIPLKAAVTEHNKDWTLSQLIGHLTEEHEYMNRKQN